MTEREPDSQRLKLHTRASIAPPSRVETRDLDGSDTASLLKKAKARAQDPSIFDEVEPYFFFTESSNNTIDWYGTRMHESSLKNYAKNLQEGRSFLNDHNMTQRIGQSLDGWYVEEEDTHADGEPVRRTIGAFFTMPGVRWANMGTDDFITGVRSGAFKDVSIGFWADDMRCSVCGGQMYQGWFGTFGIECDHVPGMEYAVDAEGNEVKADEDTFDRMQMCYIWVHDGEMAETSNVYDGATPDAGFTKAKAMAERGKLDLRTMQRFEAKYNAKLPRMAAAMGTPIGDNAIATTPAGIVVPAPLVTDTTTTNRTNVMAQRAPQEDSMAKAADMKVEINWEQIKPGLVDMARSLDLTVADDATPETIIDQMGEKFRALTAETAELRTDAEIGKRYREELIEDALKEGVRAKGDEFKSDVYKAILTNSTVEGIKLMRDDWQKDGDVRLAGGPKAVTGDEPIDIETKRPSERAVPDRAYVRA